MQHGPRAYSRPPPRGVTPWLWSGLAAIMVGVFATLWFTARPLYFGLLNLWSFQAFRFPFLDSLFYITNRQCFGRGVDVYAANPCDVLNRVFSNSPFCLRLFLIPDDPAWNPLFGGALVLGFILSLAALPRIAGRPRQWRFLAALFSPAVMFALERANLDLFIYALATLIMLALGGRLLARLLGYGLTLFGFLVKFYPIMLILLAARERPRLAVAVWSASAAVIAAYVWQYHHELVLMAPLVPHPSPFGYDLGAVLFAEGVGDVLRLNLIPWLVPLQMLASLVIAWRIMGGGEFGAAMARLGAREKACLLTGSLLLTGCFFTGVSIGYRALHMLLILPGLMALSAWAPPGRAAGTWRHGPSIALLLLWSPVLLRLAGGLHYIPQAPLPAVLSLLVWTGREFLWWWLATLMLAVLMRAGLEMTTPLAWRSTLPWLDRLLPERAS